eukprot:249579-Rhodomonas_salina.2
MEQNRGTHTQPTILASRSAPFLVRFSCMISNNPSARPIMIANHDMSQCCNDRRSQLLCALTVQEHTGTARHARGNGSI